METTPKLSRRDMRHQQQQRRGQGRRQRTDAGEVDAPASGSLVANAREDEPSNEPSEPFGKWSTHFDASVTFTVRGVPLSLHQDPTSDNIGHSVWDVSRAVARFLEVDPWWRRELGRHRRVVELGAGCGLVGIAAAVLGGHVTLTDLPSVHSLLSRNAHSALSSPGVRALHGVGTASVADLAWLEEWPEPPVLLGDTGGKAPDLIVGTDIVYFAELVEPLVQTLVAVAGPHTTVLLANERRIPRVHAHFLERISAYFKVRPVRLDVVGAEIDTSAFETYELRKLVRALNAAAATTPEPHTS